MGFVYFDLEKIFINFRKSNHFYKSRYCNKNDGDDDEINKKKTGSR